MNVIHTPLAGVVVCEPRVFGDERGYFFESYHRRKYEEAGIDATFVQDNVSRSVRGVLRGLHHQWPNPQGKLVSVLHGEVFDVAVDIRRGSPTFGRWFGITLSAENKRQLFIPPGFAHGFQVLSEDAVFTYKCTAFYDHTADQSILWSDPAIGIDWPLAEPQLSPKDREAAVLASVPADKLPQWAG